MWVRRVLVLVALIGVAGAGALAPAPAQTRSWPATAAAERGAAFIAERQDASGSLVPGQPRADEVADGVVALVAAGGSRDAVERALAYMAGRPAEEMTRGGQYGRAIMGIVAGRKNPRDFGGRNYVRAMADHYNPATGQYDPGIYGHALALLGLVAAGEAVPEMAITFLRTNECNAGGTTGGFGHDLGCSGGADIDTTAIVLCALVASRVSPADGIRVRTRNYLLAAQNSTGGYGFERGEADNANSTALALSAVVALGENPTASPWARPDGANPAKVLLGLQHDSGGFRVDAKRGEPDVYATFQSVPPLAGVPYPVPPRATAASVTTTTTPRADATPATSVVPVPGATGSTVAPPPVGGGATPPPPGGGDGSAGADLGDGEETASRRGQSGGGDDSIPTTVAGIAGLLLAGAAGLVLRQRART